jgi:hypothetical protein
MATTGFRRGILLASVLADFKEPFKPLNYRSAKAIIAMMPAALTRQPYACLSSLVVHHAASSRLLLLQWQCHSNCAQPTVYCGCFQHFQITDRLRTYHN